MSEKLLRGRIPTQNRDQNLPPIVMVNDFGNGLSPAECQLSIINGFDAHSIPNGVRSQFVHIGDIQPFNVVDGAFQMSQVAENRRGKRTVFVGVVDPGVGTERRGIVARTRDHIYIAPDNGLSSLAWAGQTLLDVHAVDKQFFENVAPTFHGRDVFAPLAAELAAGADPSTIPVLEKMKPDELITLNLQPGHVVHHDGYKNVKLWQQGIPLESDGQPAEALTIVTERIIFERLRRHITLPVVRTFEDVGVGEWLALEGSSGRKRNAQKAGHVEVAIRDRARWRGAGTRLRTPVGEVVGLEWHYSDKRAKAAS